MKPCSVIVLTLMSSLGCVSLPEFEAEAIQFEPRYLLLPLVDVEALERRETISSIEVNSFFDTYEVSYERLENFVKNESDKLNSFRPMICGGVIPIESASTGKPINLSIVGFREESRLIGGQSTKIFWLKLE